MNISVSEAPCLSVSQRKLMRTGYLTEHLGDSEEPMMMSQPLSLVYR